MDFTLGAWLILRLVYAWMFLMPLPGLLKNWSATVNLTGLLIPFAKPFCTAIYLLCMFFCALAIFFGIYAKLAAIPLFFISVFGVRVHYLLAKQAAQLGGANSNEEVQQIIALAQVGNITSAQKNVVLAAVALFFVLMGSGPMSLIELNF